MKVQYLFAHPKHIHIFRNFISKFHKSQDEYLALVVSKEKQVFDFLLEKYNIRHRFIGKNMPCMILKMIEYPFRVFKAILITLRFKPNLLIGQAEPTLGIISKLLKIPFIALPDTETSTVSTKFTFKLTDLLLVSTSYRNKLDYENVKIKSYLELMYLHPNVFTPENSVLEEAGLAPGEKYVVIRFVSWNAQHDIGHKGITPENKIRIVEAFTKYAKVFISSELELPEELKKYKINIDPEKMHSFLHYATLFYGESATMAAESAVLGTPAIYLDNDGRGYTDELESKFDLMYNYTESLEDQDKSIHKGTELLSLENIKTLWKDKKEAMLNEQIDYNSFLVWFAQNYPQSLTTMKENPDFQNKFK